MTNEGIEPLEPETWLAQFNKLAGRPHDGDTLASSLWALDFLYWWASHDAAGINCHTGDKVAANEELKITVNGQPTLNRVQPSSFGEDFDGELYVCDHSHGIVYRIAAEAGPNLSAK